MNKLYLTYNNKYAKREYYSYTVLSSNPVYVTLKPEEIEAYLSRITTSNITNIKEINDHLVEIDMERGETIIIDNIRVFNFSDKYDSYISALQNKIKKYMEHENISNYKKSLPEGYKPRVNRTRKKKNSGKLLVSSVSIAMAILLTANLLKLEINKDKENAYEDINPKQITYLTSTKNNIAQLENHIEIPEIEVIKSELIDNEIKDDDIEVKFAFEDWTNTGKLEQTINLCSPYMEQWINRYGLPRDLTYSLCSLEKGTLDCSPQNNGACGPMQIQVNPQHGEHYKVPVYENGVFTGEYDEFWAADINKLDDPSIVGKPIKIIQNLEDNFQIGCAYFRRCIDKYKNIFIALDAYNKGLYALPLTYDLHGDSIKKPLEYYKENFNDFSWTSIIPSYSNKVFGVKTYGDPNYLLDVLKYLKTDERGSAIIEYCYGNEVIRVDLSNTNVYNSEISKGL